MSEKLKNRFLSSVTVPRTAVMLALTLAMCTASAALADGDSDSDADYVTISPTYLSASDIPADLGARRGPSLATLDAIQAAIDDADSEGRTIKLQTGFYDFMAVVNPDNPANEFDFYNGKLQDGTPTGFGSHALKSKKDEPRPAYGVVIIGKEDLTIQGTLDADGDPATVLLGNPDPSAAHFSGPNSPAFYNIGFTVAGGSTDITLQDLRFEQFAISLLTRAPFSSPSTVGLVADPQLLGGTEDLRIENNTFVPTESGIVLNGNNRRPSVEGNLFLMDVLGASQAVTVWGAEGAPLVRPRIEGNTILGGAFGVVPLWDFTEDGVIENNQIEAHVVGIFLAGASGWKIEGNRVSDSDVFGILVLGPQIAREDVGDEFVQIAERNVIKGNTVLDNGVGGIVLFGTSNNQVEGNSVHGSVFGLWIEWTLEIFTDLTNGLSLVQLAAEDNVAEENDLTGNVFGAFLGALGRNNTLVDNDVSGSAVAGYFLNSPETIGFFGLTFGRASGNRIIDERLGTPDATVIDLAACGPGPCPQTDYDGDGLLNEDEIDGVNDDADFRGPFWLIDEDPSDSPNIIGDDDDEDSDTDSD